MKAAFFSVLLCVSVALVSQETVPFAVGEWAPYVGISFPDKGTAARIVRDACEAAGLAASFDFYPWVRAERRVLDGLAFASFPYLRIPERESRFLFSEPILNSSISILRATGDGRTSSFVYGGRPEELRSFVVGTTAGTEAVAGPLRDAGVEVEQTETLDQSIQKLERGRIHFVIEEREVIEDAIRRLYPGRAALFSFLDRDFSQPRNYRLLVSRTYPGARDLLERFNGGLAAVKKGRAP